MHIHEKLACGAGLDECSRKEEKSCFSTERVNPRKEVKLVSDAEVSITKFPKGDFL
ncbi:MAG: hypothetical protein QXO59_01810 [Candidatus Jordarchaeales archaeon]